MKSNFISCLTSIKSMVTAVKIVLFHIHQQNGHFTTEFRKKFLCKMDYNIIRHFFSKSSCYLQTFFVINFLRNEKQFYYSFLHLSI